MKKILLILILLASFVSYGQVVTTKTVSIPNASTAFVDNVPAFSKIINKSNYKEYLVLQPLSGLKMISTCTLGVDIIESGIGSYKYSNDSTGTTSGYVNLARFYSSLATKLNYRTFGTAANSTTSDFIRNRYTSGEYTPQNASFWISGPATFDGDVSVKGFLFNNIYTSAPFSVNSTVKVDYLNSDLLDGKDGSYYHNYDSLANKPTIPVITGKKDKSDSVVGSGYYTNYKALGKLNLTGGTLSGDLAGISLSMVASPNVASITGWTTNNDSCSIYGTNAIGYPGDDRKIFRAGMYLGSNGFTVDWNDTTSRFEYLFQQGDVTVRGQMVSDSVIKFGGLGSQILLANGTVVDTSHFSNFQPLENQRLSTTNSPTFDTIKVVSIIKTGETDSTKVFTQTGNTLVIKSGDYTPTLTKTANIDTVLLIKATYSRVGNIVHVMLFGTITTTASGATDLRFTLPIATTATIGYGVGTVYPTVYSTGAVVQVSTTQASLQFSPTSATSGWFSIQFDYVIN